MLEEVLDLAICRAFSGLLRDLYDSGYRIEPSQATLLGRRLDLLLHSTDGRVCIIELKAGAPPMPDVRDQILDYAECWRTSYPTQTNLRLIVIGNSIPENKLANFGVESRAITQAQVLHALEQYQPDGQVKAGLKLIPDDLDKVKHLLSDHESVAVPDGLILQPPWNHEKVFLALIERGEKHKELPSSFSRLYIPHRWSKPAAI